MISQASFFSFSS